MDILKVNKLKDIVDKSKYIVFLGGAGTSTESDIPDFRSTEGLYSKKSNYNVPPEEILSIGFFNSQTDAFYKYYRDNLIHPDAMPNLAHKALYELEKRASLKAVVTQNIDGLHQMAGSKNVIEIHGSLYKNYCQECGKKFNVNFILDNDGVPLCDECGGKIRPDVVMYGEPLDQILLEKSINHVSKADLLIVGGTSLKVYPAAGLIRYFNGQNLVIINKTETKYDSLATMVFKESIGRILEKVVMKDE
ncbi:MAG: NAD-dependent protein deacylase [Bacillota bacterium]|nr:NAD-dependent protein deacylase [Bacillota bacterium]